ncbi:hypothetical protein, partial [Natronobacterium gregoryi]
TRPAPPVESDRSGVDSTKRHPGLVAGGFRRRRALSTVRSSRIEMSASTSGEDCHETDLWPGRPVGGRTYNSQESM